MQMDEERLCLPRKQAHRLLIIVCRQISCSWNIYKNLNRSVSKSIHESKYANIKQIIKFYLTRKCTPIHHNTSSNV